MIRKNSGRNSRLVALLLSVLACTLVVASATTAAARTRGDDEESELYMQEARRAIAARDYPKAGKLLDRALSSNPRRLDTYVLRASVHAVQKQFALGVAVMRRAYRLAPDNPNVLTALGTQLILARQYDEGVPLLERVVVRWPDRYEAHAVLGHHYTRTGAYRKAITELDAYFKTRPAELAKEDPTHLVDLANAHLRLGDAAAARALYRKVLAADAKNVLGRLGLAWATAAIDCKQAIPLLRGLADLADKHPAILLVQARCELTAGTGQEALTLAERYNRAVPAAAEGWALLGEARAATGDMAGGRAAFGEAVQREPKNQRYALRLARLERQSGEATAAAARLRAAGAPAGQETEWTHELAEALAADGRPHEVLELLAPWVAAHADDAAAHARYGLALLQTGDAAAAIEHLERALALDPQQERARQPLVTALNLIAVAAVGSGDLVGAETLLVRADAVAESAVTWRNLGAVRIMAGKAALALPVLIRATTADATDGVALALLGRAYRLAGKNKEAVATLRAALARAGARATDVSLDLAAALLDGGDAAGAMTVVEGALETITAGPEKQRLLEAYVTAARASGTVWMRAGNFERAYRVLDDAERRAFPRGGKDASALGVALHCDLALAATAAGYRDLALVRLRQLEHAKASCPFAAPADQLAVPILIAWNEGSDLANADKALGRLEALRKKATGAARPLVADAARSIALRAAVDAWSKGKTARARLLLDKAAKYDPDNRGPELAHDLAVLQLEDGDVDGAIAALARVADVVPEALVNLGIAHDLKKDPRRALEYYRAAGAAGVRFAPLKSWIAAKARLWGGEEQP